MKEMKKTNDFTEIYIKTYLFSIIFALLYAANNSSPWLFALRTVTASYLDIFEAQDPALVTGVQDISYPLGVSLFLAQFISYSNRLIRKKTQSSEKKASSPSFTLIATLFFNLMILFSISGIFTKSLGSFTNSSLFATEFSFNYVKTKLFKDIGNGLLLLLSAIIIFPNTFFAQLPVLVNTLRKRKETKQDASVTTQNNIFEKFALKYVNTIRPESIASLANWPGTLLYANSCFKLIKYFSYQFLKIANNQAAKSYALYIALFALLPITFFSFFVIVIFDKIFSDELHVFKKDLEGRAHPDKGFLQRDAEIKGEKIVFQGKFDNTVNRFFVFIHGLENKLFKQWGKNFCNYYKTFVGVLACAQILDEHSSEHFTYALLRMILFLGIGCATAIGSKVCLDVLARKDEPAPSRALSIVHGGGS